MWKPLKEVASGKKSSEQDVMKIPTGARIAEGFFPAISSEGTIHFTPFLDEQQSVGPWDVLHFGSLGNPGNAIRELTMNIVALRNDIQELSKTIKTAFPPREDVLVIRDVSKERAAQEISDLLQSTAREIYPSDISEQLGIDYDLVTEVLNDLHKQGKVEFP